MDSVDVGLPEPTADRGVVEHDIDHGIPGTPQRVTRSIAPRVEGEIHIPREELPPEAVPLVGVHVLAAPHAIGIPVANDPLEGEGPHPVIDIDRAEDPVHIGGPGRVHRLDQLEKVGHVVGRALNGAFAPAPAIPGGLQRRTGRSGRGREPLQGGIDIAEAGAVILELEPVLDLVEVGVPPLGEEPFGIVPVRLLGILHDVPELTSIPVQTDVAAVEVTRTDPAGDREAQLLPEIGRVAAHVARRGQRHLPDPEHRLVIGEDHIPVAATAMERTALVLEARPVDHPAVAVDEGEVAVEIVERGGRVPGVLHGRGIPHVVVAEGSEGNRFAPADETLPRRSLRRKFRRHRETRGIDGLDPEGDEGSGGTAGDRPAVHAITGSHITPGTVIAQRDVDGRSRAIDPSDRPHRRHAVGIRDPGGDHDSLLVCRQSRRVGDVDNRGAGVGHGAGVRESWGPEVRGHGQGGRQLQPVAADPEQHLGPTRHPSDPRPDRRGRPIGQSRRQGGPDAVVPGVATTRSPDMQTAGTLVGTHVVDRRLGMVSLEGPAGGRRPRTRLEPGIRQEIRRGPGSDHLD